MNRDIADLREVVKKLVPLLTGKGLKVTQRGSSAFVEADPKTLKPVRVNIPNIPDNATPEFVRAIQGFIDHEVGHVLVTDWTYYGALTNEEEKTTSRRDFIGTHNMVEDVMIEREMSKIFPGSGRNLSIIREWFLKNITDKALKSAKNEREAFLYIMVPMLRALGGHEEMVDWMDRNGYWKNKYVDAFMKTIKPETLTLLKKCTTTKETLEIAKEVHEITTGKTKEPEKNSKSEDKPEEKAGEGDGDGERDHSESQPGDASEKSKDDGKSSDAGDEEKEDASEQEGKEDTKSDKDEDEDASEQEDEQENKEDAKSDKSEDGDASDEEGGKNQESADAEGENEDGAGAQSGDGEDEEGDGKSESGSSQPGTGEGGDSDDAAATSDGPSVITDGASGGGEELREEPDTPSDAEGGSGVGNAEAKSVFDFEGDEFNEADLGSQIAIQISRKAVDAANASDYSVFTRDFDKVEPVKVSGTMPSKWVPEMEEEVSTMTGRMQKDIERMLASQSHVIRTPGHRTGKLHAPSLFRVTQGDPRVFTQKQEHRSKDTAVSIVIDNSGSMMGGKMSLAMTAAYALCVTLGRVNINHEVIGFTTGNYWYAPAFVADEIRKEAERGFEAEYDRTIPLVMPIYKTFDEKLNSVVKDRFAYMKNAQNGLNGNIDGESLQIAAERLMRQREKRKVMIVLSDGQPAGSHRAPEHLALTTKELTKMGVDLVGIGVMTDAVQDYYENYVILQRAEDLPGQVMKEISKILS